MKNATLLHTIREFKQRRWLRQGQRNKVVWHALQCISLPYSTKQQRREKKIRFLKTTWAYNNEPFIVYFPLKPFVPIQLQDSSPVLYKLNKRKYLRNTGDSAKLYFGVTFSLSLLCLNYLLSQVWGASAGVLQGTLVCCRMDLFQPRYRQSPPGNADDSADDSHSK